MFKTLLFSVVALWHPLHVSVTEIEYSSKDKALQIILRIFTDDLEAAIRKKHQNENLNLLNSDQSTIDSLIKGYLEDRFKVVLDEKKQSIRYLGHENEMDAMVCYVEVPNVRKWKTMTVENAILLELFEDQSNIINVYVNGAVKSARLNQHQPSGRFIFQ